MGEDVAVDAMRAGANDYLVKGRLARLPAVVDRELRQSAARAARRSLERAFASLREVASAIGGLPEPRAVAELAAKRARDFAHASGSAVYAWDSGAQLLRALDDPATGLAVPRLLNTDLSLQPSVVPISTPLPELVRASGLSRIVPNRLQPRLGTHWDHSRSRPIQGAIEHAAPCGPGSSGAPVLDRTGRIRQAPRRLQRIVRRPDRRELLGRWEHEPQRSGLIAELRREVGESAAGDVPGLPRRPAGFRPVAVLRLRVQVHRTLEHAQGRIVQLRGERAGLHQVVRVRVS